MNSYILFFPDATVAGPAPFEAAGIPNLVTDARFFDSHNTPTGGPGKFAAWGDPTSPAKTIPMAYEPESQVWQEGPGGRYWFGWWQDRVPDPESLLRPKGDRIAGRFVTMGDGRDWMLPLISNLPVSFRFRADGGEETEVKPRWKGLEKRLLWAWGVVESEVRSGQEPDEMACRRYVAEMLAVNYRLSPDMAAMLGLIDSETWKNGFLATLDLDRLLALRDSIVSRGERLTPAP